MTAPEASVTVPCSEPVEAVCACRQHGATVTRRQTKTVKAVDIDLMGR
jgi:hypothetical protein